MSKVYRAGAIGRTGRGNFGHGLHTCYGEVERVSLVAVADDDPDGLERAKQETGAATGYSDYAQMLRDEQLDIVSVCPRWVDCHEEMITAALEAGCHVYSEKPMTHSLESADRVIALAEEKGLKIAVAHQAPYLPQVQSILEEIGKGRIGDVVSMVSAGKCDHRGGGEDLIVLGTHIFNLMRIIAGDPVSVTATVTVDGKHITKCDIREAGEPVGPIAGDALSAHYEFEGGVTGSFESRRRDVRDGRPYGLEIRGTAGAIAFDASAEKVTILEDDAVSPWDAAQQRKSLPLVTEPLMRGNVHAIEDLVESIETGRDPLSSAKGARTALEMILGVYQAEISGRRVEIPLEERRHPLEVWAE